MCKVKVGQKRGPKVITIVMEKEVIVRTGDRLRESARSVSGGTRKISAVEPMSDMRTSIHVKMRVAPRARWEVQSHSTKLR